MARPGLLGSPAVLGVLLLLSWGVCGQGSPEQGLSPSEDAQLDSVLESVLGKNAALRATAAAHLGGALTKEPESASEVVRRSAAQDNVSVADEGETKGKGSEQVSAGDNDHSSGADNAGAASDGAGKGKEEPEGGDHRDVRQEAEGLGLQVLSGAKTHHHAPPPAQAGSDSKWSAGSHNKVHTPINVGGVDPGEVPYERLDYAKKRAEAELDNVKLYGEHGNSATVHASNLEREHFDFSSLTYDEVLNDDKIPKYTYEENLKSLPATPLPETTEAVRMMMARADPQYHPATGYMYRANLTDPTYLHVRLFIENIHDVSIKDGEFSGEFTIKAVWHDPRLAFREQDFDGAKYIMMSGLDKNFDMYKLTWQPHLFIYNAISLKNLKQNFRLYRNGSVEYIRSFTGAMTNMWDLKLFPFDTQHVYMLLEEWKDSASSVVILGDELTLNPRMDGEILEYKVTSIDRPDEGVFDGYDNSISFSYVNYHFSITRRVGGYFSKNFLPLAFITLAGCISFMIDPKAVPARISVVCLTFLTALAYSGSISKELPNVAELTVMDQYMMISIGLAFFNVFEFAYVHVMGRVENKEGKQLEIFWEVGKMADRVSVFVYPALFLILNVVYLVVVPFAFGEFYEW